LQEELARTMRDVGEPDEVEERIRERAALAQAEVELASGSPAAALRELDESAATQSARSRLQELRREAGLRAGNA
jgi:phage shock protein A